MLYAMQCALPEKDKPAAEEIYLYDNQTNEVFDAAGEVVDFTKVKDWGSLPWPMKPRSPDFYSKEVPIRFKERRLKVLKIQLGLACNYHCSYCLQAAFRDKTPEFPSEIVVDSFFEKIDKAGITLAPDGKIELWGGEPLVYWKTLVHLIPKLRAKWGPDVVISMVTNGSLLTSAMVDFLMSYKIHVAISHDGPGFSLRNDVDPLTVPKTKMAWLYLLDRSIEAGIPMGFNVVLTKNNTDLRALQAFFRDQFSPRAGFGIEGIVSYSGAESDGGRFTAEDARKLDTSVFDVLLTEPELWPSLDEKVRDIIARLVYRVPAETMPGRCNNVNDRVLVTDLAGRITGCQSWPASAFPVGNLSDYDGFCNDHYAHWKARTRCPHCLVLASCKGGCPQLTETAHQACCENEFIFNMALFGVAWYRLTGKILTSTMPVSDPDSVLENTK